MPAKRKRQQKELDEGAVGQRRPASGTKALEQRIASQAAAAARLGAQAASLEAQLATAKGKARAAQEAEAKSRAALETLLAQRPPQPRRRLGAAAAKRPAAAEGAEAERPAAQAATGAAADGAAEVGLQAAPAATAQRVGRMRRPAAAAEDAAGNQADLDARSRRFTPELLLPGACMARTWASGRGGQCRHQPVEGGAGLCQAHSVQAVRSAGGLPHGRVDGPVPLKKLLEFEKFSAGGGAAAAAPQAGAAPVAAGGGQQGSVAAGPRPAEHAPEPREAVGESREASVVAAQAVAQALRELREPLPGGC
ncbi:unnamed protein product [Prorocentrum cordatum]|uniref:Uncharacterized protein n=1 Tax=Prorocentrum cordatum TaxID=2364126 RepID=A0ABN9Q7Z8_9DINO|nr:unnamed protein product [Polarella glacialis]